MSKVRLKCCVVLAVLAVFGSLLTPVGAAQSVVAPGAPQNPSASLPAHTDGGRLTLSWEAPASEGSSAVTSYEVQYRRADAAEWTVWARTGEPTDLVETITGLDNWETYTTRVAARSSAGLGDYAEAAEAVPVPNIALDAANTDANGLWSDGVTALVVDTDGQKIFAYSLLDGSRMAEADVAITENRAAHASPSGVCWDGTRLWVGDTRPMTRQSVAFGYLYDRSSVTFSNPHRRNLGQSANIHALWCDSTRMLAAMYLRLGGMGSVRAYRLLDIARRDKDLDRGADPWDSGRRLSLNDIVGVWSDRVLVWVADMPTNTGSADLFAYAAATGTRIDDLTYEYPVTLTSVGGIWSDGAHIWVVGADTGRIFKFPLPQAADGPPVPVRARVSEGGDTVTVTWSEPLDTAATPAAASFEVTVGTAAVALASVAHASGDSTSVVLTMSTAIESGSRESTTVAYTGPTGADTAAVRDVGGTAALTFEGLRTHEGRGVTTTPPVVSVHPGGTANSLMAVDDRTHTTTMQYVWVAATAACDSTTDFSSPTAYTEGTDVGYTAVRNTQRLCFASTDGDGDTGYRASAAVTIDVSAPSVTVGAGRAANSFKATDDDSGTTAWHHVWIAGSAVCDSTADFSSATAYTEGADVGYTTDHNDQKLCFRSRDAIDNDGFGASATVSLTVVTLPAAPTGLSASARHGVLLVSWEAPAAADPAAESYVVRHKPASAPDTDWIISDRLDAGTRLSQSLSGLANDQSYLVAVAAVNDAGQGPWATVTAAPTGDIPLAERNSHHTLPLAIWSNGSTVWVSQRHGSRPDLYAYGLRTGLRDSAEDHDFGYSAEAPVTALWGSAGRIWVARSQLGRSGTGGRTFSVDAYERPGFGHLPGSSWTQTALAEAGITDPRGLWSDGTTMWIADAEDDKLYAFTLSTRRRDPDKDFDTLGDGTGVIPWGMWSDGDTIWVPDGKSNKVYAHSMHTRRRVPARDISGLADAKGVWSDGTTMWIVTTARIEAVDLPEAMVPQAPEGLTLVPGDGGATVTWQTPGDDGGRPVTFFWMRHKSASAPDADASWTTVYRIDPGDRGLVIGGLTNGETYDVQIRARNDVGVGDWTQSSQVTPAAPFTVTVEDGVGPNTRRASDGVPAVSAWHYIFIDGETSCDVGTDFTSATPYTEDADVTFTRRDRNKRLCFRSVDGENRAAFGAALLEFDRPTQSRNVRAVAGNGWIELKWEAPESDNGSTVTSYWVGYRPDDETDPGWITWTNQPAAEANVETITGLLNGTPYRVSVMARNLAGSGSSVEVRATPSPDADTTAPTVTVAAGSDDNTFTATDGDSDTTAWHYAWIPGTDACDATTDFASATPYTEGADVTYTSADDGQRLCFRSSDGANTGYGASAVISTTPSAPLSAPRNMAFTSGDGQLALTWNEPSSDGGVAVTGYAVRYRVKHDTDPPDWTEWTRTAADATDRAETITGLANWAVYEVEVAARNGPDDADIGPYATLAQAMPAPRVELRATLGDRVNPYGLWGDAATLWVVDRRAGVARAFARDGFTRDAAKDLDFASLNAANTLAWGMCSDGTTTWISDVSDGRLYAYEFDGSNWSYVASKNITVSGASTAPKGLWCDDAELLASVGANYDDVGAWRLPERVGNPAREVIEPPGSPYGFMGIWSDGVTVWLSTHKDFVDVVRAFSPHDGARREWLDFDPRAVGGHTETANGIWSDGTSMWVVDRSTDRLFEYRLPRVESGPPVPVSAELSSDRSTITVTFSEALDTGVTPAAARFSVVVDGNAAAPSSVHHATGDDTAVTLTLSSAPTDGVTVTVAYSDASDSDDTSGVVQDTGGADAPAFTKVRVPNPDAGGTLPPAEPLTAQFSGLPADHDGTTPFTFELRFSEEFDLSYITLRDHAFTVTNGTVTGARRLNRGSNIGWQITVRPSIDADITITLPAPHDCTSPRALCNRADIRLTQPPTLAVPGPDSP